MNTGSLTGVCIEFTPTTWLVGTSVHFLPVPVLCFIANYLGNKDVANEGDADIEDEVENGGTEITEIYV